MEILVEVLTGPAGTISGHVSLFLSSLSDGETV
jgi:hypothetical protein